MLPDYLLSLLKQLTVQYMILRKTNVALGIVFNYK